MQKSTKGRGPVIVAALGTVVVALLFFGSLLWVMLEEEPMVQRLREIQGGEEDEARKY